MSDKQELFPFECAINGQVISVDSKTTSAGKKFAEIVLHDSFVSNGKTYDNKVKFSSWPRDGVNLADEVETGDGLSVICKVRGNEYNGKFYVQLELKEVVLHNKNGVETESGTVETRVDAPDNNCPF